MGKRELPAPVPEWLSKKELLNAIDLSESVLDRKVRAGTFPRGTLWDGRELKWRWWVVVWWNLHKDVQPLMRAGPLDEPEDDPEPEPGEPPKAVDKRR